MVGPDHKATKNAENLRKEYGRSPSLDKMFDNLTVSGYTSRFVRYMFGALAKNEKDPAYTSEMLRSDCVREMKGIRAKLDGKEKTSVPRALWDECQRILWNKKR